MTAASFQPSYRSRKRKIHAAHLSRIRRDWSTDRRWPPGCVGPQRKHVRLLSSQLIAVAWLPSCLSRYVSLRTCTRVPPPSSPLPAAQLACTAALILDERTKIRTRMRVNSNEHSGETRVEWPLVSKFRIYDGSRTSSVENQFSFCRSSSVQLDKSITPYLYGKWRNERVGENKDVLNRNYGKEQIIYIVLVEQINIFFVVETSRDNIGTRA